MPLSRPPLLTIFKKGREKGGRGVAPTTASQKTTKDIMIRSPTEKHEKIRTYQLSTLNSNRCFFLSFLRYIFADSIVARTIWFISEISGRSGNILRFFQQIQFELRLVPHPFDGALKSMAHDCMELFF